MSTIIQNSFIFRTTLPSTVPRVDLYTRIVCDGCRYSRGVFFFVKAVSFCGVSTTLPLLSHTCHRFKLARFASKALWACDVGVSRCVFMDIVSLSPQALGTLGHGVRGVWVEYDDGVCICLGKMRPYAFRQRMWHYEFTHTYETYREKGQRHLYAYAIWIKSYQQ